MMQAESAYNQGQFGKAIRIYQDLIKISPQSADLHWHLGIVYFSSGNTDKVIVQIKRLRSLGEKRYADDLKQLLEKNPTSP